MEVIRETLWKRRLSIPIKLPGKNSNICLSERAYQHKGTRKKCKKTNQAAIIQWQRQCLMDKPHRKPGLKSKTSDISKQSPSPLHHTFLLGRARFTAQPLSALLVHIRWCPPWRHTVVWRHGAFLFLGNFRLKGISHQWPKYSWLFMYYSFIHEGIIYSWRYQKNAAECPKQDLRQWPYTYQDC